MRRHLWAHTSIEGDGLEYTGLAKELLIGFLFALAILVPIYLAYFLIGIEAERYQGLRQLPAWPVLSMRFSNSRSFARAATAPRAPSGAACVSG